MVSAASIFPFSSLSRYIRRAVVLRHAALSRIKTYGPGRTHTPPKLSAGVVERLLIDWLAPLLRGMGYI